MALTTNYVSDLYHAMPDQSGHLAIYISESRCSIGITSDSNVVTYLQCHQKDDAVFAHEFVQSVFRDQQELFAKTYQSVDIGVETTNFTVLPSSLSYNADEVMEFLTDSPTRVSFEKPLLPVNATMVYSLPVNLHNVMTATFQQFNQHHCISFGIDDAFQLESDGYFVIDDGHVDCIIKKEGKLFSATRHAYTTNEDLLYFILLSFHDAEIDPQQAHATISGVIKKHSDTFTLLSDYIETVDLQPLKGNVTIRPDFEQPLQVHQYLLNLLNANN